MEEKETPPEGQKPKKGRGRMIIIIAVVLTVAAGGAAAAFFLRTPAAETPGKAHAKEGHPKAGHSKEEAAEEEADGPKEEEEEEVELAPSFEPLVVDVHGEDDKIHHLKVGLAAEMAKGAKEEDFKIYSARGREAAVVYLRGLPFEVATSPEKFGQVREELCKRVRLAMGKHRVQKVIVTDFVAQ